MLFGVVYFVSVSVFGSYPSGWKIQHLCAFYMCDVQYCMSVFGSILHPGKLLISSSQSLSFNITNSFRLVLVFFLFVF